MRSEMFRHAGAEVGYVQLPQGCLRVVILSTTCQKD